MEIELNLEKTVEQNAEIYYEKVKKLKKKVEGATEALGKTKIKLEIVQTKQELEKEKNERQVQVKQRKKEWFEKFRWFISSTGFLVIGGRDASTNELIIKKYTDKEDLVLHAEAPGSPFVVIKSESKKIDKETIKEAAIFTASFSSSWKRGLRSGEVFCVKPEQVTKEAKAGEYISKGSFMIYGKKDIHIVTLQLALGIDETRRVMAGPLAAIKKNTKDYIELEQGNTKVSDIGKKIKKRFDANLDEIIRAIPPGSKLKK